MKDLDLAGFDFVSSWDKLPFVAGLVRLRLNSPSKLKLPQTKAFVRALQQLPLLERLDLRNILPVAGYKKTSPPAAQDTLFSFPKLRCLTLRESSNAVNDFLEVSCFPRCTYILLVLPDNPITPESIRRTLANIAAVAIPKRNSPHAFEHPSHLRDIHLNNRESTQSSRRFLYIGFIFNRHIFGAEKSDLTVDLGACLPFNIGEFLSLAHSHLDFSTLRLIELASCERLLPNKVWLASFSRLKSLNTISFNGSEFLGLLDMLVDDPALPKTMGAGGSGLAMTPYFPSLHIIAFTTVSFKTGRQSSGGDRRRPAFKRLMEYLKRRPPSWPTLTLRIEECSNFGKADYDRVSALGSKVQIEWDEQQYISSDVAEDSGDDE
ncbi:hypothetical protein NMY22_g4324 [Coprinellus aureogranulatus]|nr:hypothetical protein NMY22_g4324 [Coprinellus aureogranulatus]